jgi:hypothetical protein
VGKWCPNCGAEYVEGWGTCSDCGVELVDAPPARPATSAPRADTSFEAPDEARDDDPWIPIWEGPTPSARRLAEVVERAHIPVDLGEALEAGHSRVEVPRSYVEDARAALAEPPGDWPAIIATGPGFDWQQALRIALVIVALLLVVLMILPSL